MNQLETIERILQLKKENPNAEIKICPRNCDSDNGDYKFQSISAIELEFYYSHGDSVYIGEDDILEYFFNELDYKLSDDEAEEIGKQRFQEFAKLAILIYTLPR